jgi:hypothetical protein
MSAKNQEILEVEKRVTIRMKVRSRMPIMMVTVKLGGLISRYILRYVVVQKKKKQLSILVGWWCGERARRKLTIFLFKREASQEFELLPVANATWASSYHSFRVENEGELEKTRMLQTTKPPTEGPNAL